MIIRNGLLVLMASALCHAAAGADRSLGSFRAWTAMQFGDGKDRACMAFSEPVKSEGEYSKRGDAFVFVTHRASASQRGHVSLDTGYTYAPGSTVGVQVGDLRLELRTRGSTAWVEDGDDGARLIGAMRAGREMVVEGTSSRGTKTRDHYSLYGFSAAKAAIDKACPG